MGRFNITHLISLIGVFVILVTINVGVTQFLIARSDMSRPAVVTVNAADLIVRSVSLLDPSVSEQELAAHMRAMNAELPEVVRTISLQNNLVVVNSASVLSGAPDITDVVSVALMEAVLDE